MTQSERTPFLALDPAKVEESALAIRAALPECEVFYALKANPHPAVVSALDKLDVGFEIASESELDSLVGGGISASRVICLHPIKSPDFLKRLHVAGVKSLAVDCAAEVAKVAKFAPGSAVLARLSISDTGSRVPLDGKFGCPPVDASGLLAQARDLGLRPAGLTLHVGSQCESAASWERAMRLCRDVAEELSGVGLLPDWVSLGGGWPVGYAGDVSGLGEIATVLRRNGLAELADRCTVSLEPGRALVATAGSLVASVIGVAERNGERWVYLDAGIYHGLFEMLPAAGGLPLPVEAMVTDRPQRAQRLAGPTCDSLDVLPNSYLLPELRVGDRVAFGMAGAYSTSIATNFNGFPAPKTIVLGEDRNQLLEPLYATYETDFDPRRYLRQYYSRSELAADDAELFRTLSGWLRAQGRVFERALDLGCGPTLHNSFALAPFARSIELAEFLPGNLEEIRKWIAQDSDAHDWDALLRGVLTCEGASPNELEARKALYRSRVSRLQHCDLRRDAPLEREQKFDLVTSFFCAECFAESRTSWTTIIHRIAGLVRPGGALFMAAVGNASRYAVLGKWFKTLPVVEADFPPLLESNGFAPKSIQTWSVPAPDWAADGFDHIILVSANKLPEGANR